MFAQTLSGKASRLAAAALCAAPLLAGAPKAEAVEAYYSAYACHAVDQFGRQTHDIRFTEGVAANFNQDTPLYLHCPVPFDRGGANQPSISVRVQGFDNTDDDAIVLRLCQRQNSGQSSTCTAAASSGAGFQNGFATLTRTIEPSPSTRWIYARIEVPDQDAQSGRSYVIGYRVCRGGC
ncbi:MAG: hypothetical protein AAF322_10390 [Pseudomonadota bacterium]